MDKMLHYFKALQPIRPFCLRLQFVLFGFRPDLTSQTDRSVSNHSYCYAFSPVRPVCFARSTLNSESFMQYAG